MNILKCTTRQALAREVHVKYKRGDSPTSLITRSLNGVKGCTLGYTSNQFSGALWTGKSRCTGPKTRVGPGQRPPNRPETRQHNCYGNRPKGRKLPTAKMTHATSSKKKYSPVCMSHSTLKNEKRKTINSHKSWKYLGTPPTARAQREAYKIIKQVQFGTSKTANRGLSEI